VDIPPPSGRSVSSASPTITKGWPADSTFPDTRWGLFTTLVTRWAGWHSTPAGGDAYTDAPSPLAPSSVSPPPSTRVTVPELPMEGWTRSGRVAASPQSRASRVRPDRQRRAPASTRLSPALPLALAAMQKGKHAAVGMHALGSRRLASCPHRGTTHTVASTSRHVPREMQSVEASDTVDEPTVAAPAPGWVYRVKGNRTDLT